MRLTTLLVAVCKEAATRLSTLYGVTRRAGTENRSELDRANQFATLVFNRATPLRSQGVRHEKKGAQGIVYN